jgi:hypothetical protein
MALVSDLERLEKRTLPSTLRPEFTRHSMDVPPSMFSAA